MDLKEEKIFGGAINDHWYYVAKARALKDFLGDVRADEVLDVGAGSGVFSRYLLGQDICKSAICVDHSYEEERAVGHNGKPIAFVKTVQNVPQKLILMMDVLEHVDDDVGLLRQYADRMPQGGQILITVPAFQFLWSGHDVFLGHRRRYTAVQLHETIRGAGSEPVKTRYFYGTLFPAMALIRLLRRNETKARSDLKLYPDWLNKTLIVIHDIERHTLFRVNKLAGLSIFCLCKKP